MKFSRNWAQPCNNKSGGDGETRLIKEIFGLKDSKGKKISDICPTSIAATQYNFHATTQHKWAGIKDELMRLQELTSCKLTH